MDRLEKLERKVAVLAKWYGPGRCSHESVTRDLAAIDAEPAEVVKPAEPAKAPPGWLGTIDFHAALNAAGVPGMSPQREQIIALARGLIAERDAYKRAKAENGERFMIERDTARHDRDVARAEVERLRAQLRDEAWMHSACLTIADGGEARAAEKTYLNSPAMDAVRTLVRDLATLRARDAEARWLIDKRRGYTEEWETRRDAYLANKPTPDPLLVEVLWVLGRAIDHRPHHPKEFGCQEWEDRRDKALAQLDARIGGRNG